jgi:hypothetical protein
VDEKLDKACRLTESTLLKLKQIKDNEDFPNIGSVVERTVTAYETRNQPLTIMAYRGTTEMWMKSV